jgi:hypothetical protein
MESPLLGAAREIPVLGATREDRFVTPRASGMEGSARNCAPRVRHRELGQFRSDALYRQVHYFRVRRHSGLARGNRAYNPMF